MTTEPPAVTDPDARAPARQAISMLSFAAAGLVVLGVLVMFLPPFGSAPLREIMGAVVIAGGAFIAVYVVFLRRRLL
jgi:hypothetical protein